MNMPPEYSLWAELGVVLTIATSVVVVGAMLAERWIASAAWRRTIWRAAAVGLCVMLAVEFTGLGRGAGQLFVASLSEAIGGWRERSRDRRPTSVDSESVGRADGERERSTEVQAADVAPHGSVRKHSPPWTSDREAVGEQDGSDVMALAERGELDLLARYDHGWVGESNFPNELRAEPTDVGVVIESRLDSFDRLDGRIETADAAAPLAVPPHRDGTADSSAPSEPVADAMAAAAPIAGTAGSVRPSSTAPRAWPLLLWSLGCIFVLSYVFVGQVLLCVFRWRHRALPGRAVRRRAERLARRLGVRRPVRVVESQRLRTPVAFGIFAPTVILPGGFADDFEPAEQDAMLVHEMAHLAAADPAWQLAVNVLCGLLWWQPLAWWLRHRLRMASETAADEATLVVPEGPQHLASCLVAMGRRLVDAPRLGWLPMTGDGYRSNLGRRVTRLLGLERKSWRAPRRTRAAIVKSVIVVMLVTAMVTCTAWVRPRAAHAEGESTMKQLKVTWTESLAAATLVAVLGSLSGDALAETPEAEGLFAAHGPVVALLQDDEDEEREREGEARRERDDEEGEREGEARRERDDEEGEREGEARRERDDEEGEREREAHRDREREEREESDHEERRHHEREREEREREEHRERDEIERELHKLERALDELAHHEKELEHKLRELPDDADREAQEIQERLEHVRREAREIEERMHDIHEGHRDEEREEERERPEHPEEVVRHLMREREGLMAHARELHEAMEHARREGNEDAAHEIAEKIEGLKREFQRIEREVHEIRERHGHRERPRGEGGPREEIERRLHHLRVAVDNLHAAGMHEQAEQLKRQAEHLMREMQGPRREGDRERPREMHREPPRPEHREGPPPHELERAVRDMHRQMDEMRGQMEEMRRALKMLIERERGRE